MRSKQNEENKDAELDTEELMNLLDFDEDMWMIVNLQNIWINNIASDNQRYIFSFLLPPFISSTTGTLKLSAGTILSYLFLYFLMLNLKCPTFGNFFTLSKNGWFTTSAIVILSSGSNFSIFYNKSTRSSVKRTSLPLTTLSLSDTPL